MNFSASKDVPPRGRSADLFDADDYHTWIRQALALRADPTLTHLFDSTIEEPIADLGDVVRHAFWPSPTSRYVSVFGGGNPYLLAALARRYDRPENAFILTTGATDGLAMALNALAGPGDHVVVETPGFCLLEKLAKATGAETSAFPRRAPRFDIELDDLAAQLRPNTKAVIITNLHNPSGAYLAPRRIAEIAAVAARVGAVLIVDEVYGDFARDRSPLSAASQGDNIIAVNSLTKVFGLFSLKAGWMTASPDLLDRIHAATLEAGYEISKLSHTIAALVLETPEPFEAHWKRVLSANQPIVQRHAAQLIQAGLITGEPPERGCVYFPRIVDCEDSRPVARALWRQHGVMVAPGEYFGLPGHIRIGYGLANPMAIETGMTRLAAGLAGRPGKSRP